MNNEQVIKYVAENSKNPHAAMMVEQLLTGWCVELEDQPNSWVKDPAPIWHPLVKYRLVEPKMKPAYRVWKYTNDRRTYVQDRFEDGTVNAIGKPQDIQIIQDWTEYDQWPTPLVERIAAIDIKAAEWIRDNWDELLNDRYTHNGEYSRESDTLIEMFLWSSSPQDHHYWKAISEKLNK